MARRVAGVQGSRLQSLVWVQWYRKVDVGGGVPGRGSGGAGVPSELLGSCAPSCPEPQTWQLALSGPLGTPEDIVTSDILDVNSRDWELGAGRPGPAGAPLLPEKAPGRPHPPPRCPSAPTCGPGCVRGEKG